MIRVVSFNVNSLRARMDIVRAFLEEHTPAIVGLQETKVRDEDFPLEPIADLGYEVLYYGQKTHYGVALLSNVPFTYTRLGFDPDNATEQRRLIHAAVPLDNGKSLHVINGYFPQGESRDHPVKFPAKMKFYDDVFALLSQKFASDDYTLVMGDFNVSQRDTDIGIGENNRKRWLQTGKCSFLPEEREKFAGFGELGFLDTYRKIHPDASDRFTWFDYRSRGFEDTPKRGLRIDGILANSRLYELCVNAGIDYETRGMPRPSDHCPIWADFDVNI